MTNVTVTVYTKPDCQQCNATYRKLEELEVPYEKIDIVAYPEALDYVKSLGFLAAPVVEVKPTDGSQPVAWSGYRPDIMKSLFKNSDS